MHAGEGGGVTQPQAEETATVAGGRGARLRPTRSTILHTHRGRYFYNKAKQTICSQRDALSLSVKVTAFPTRGVLNEKGRLF